MNYLNRLHRLQNVIKRDSCDALLVEDPINLYYLTGLDLSAGKILVHTQGAHLLVDGRYLEICKKQSPFPVLLIDPPNLQTLLASDQFSFIERLAFDSQMTSYQSHQQLQKIADSLFANSQKLRQLQLIPLDSPLQSLRVIKEPAEIDLLRDAAALGSEGFDFVAGILKEGISEEEVAAELEIFWKRRGGKKVAFDPIIAFGANSSMPHYRAGKDRLKPDQIVLIDIGVTYQHYHSDMTRTIFFGKPDPELLKIYKIVQRAQRAAIELCRPGTHIGTLDAAARDIIIAEGYGDKFTHSLGHGVGLNIHEYPTIKNTAPYAKTPLVSGMVITIEPGIYLPDIGGVRIEDTVVITGEGHENLTKRSS